MTDQQAYEIVNCSACSKRVWQMEKPIKVKRDRSALYPTFWWMDVFRFILEGRRDEHICTKCSLQAIENQGIHH